MAVGSCLIDGKYKIISTNKFVKVFKNLYLASSEK